MRLLYLIGLFLIASMLCSMTQCNKCITGTLRVDNDAKKWLPYAGRDSVVFISSNNQLRKFKSTHIDTTIEARNLCNDVYYADLVSHDLEINPTDSLYIHSQISSPSWFCLDVRNRIQYFLGGCNVINGSESEMRRSFSSLVLNNVTYSNVILLNAYPGTAPLLDSLYFSKNKGIVTFKYNNLNYYLKE